MRRILSMGMAICLSITMLASCQRSQGVHAGNDAGDYQPRPAPESGVDLTRDRNNLASQEIKGELLSVDLRDHSMLLRVENGMEQTVKWNDTTNVYGVPYLSTSTSAKAKDARTAGELRVLAAAPGSELAIAWVDDNGQKLANVINVTDMAPVIKKSKRR